MVSKVIHTHVVETVDAEGCLVKRVTTETLICEEVQMSVIHEEARVYFYQVNTDLYDLTRDDESRRDILELVGITDTKPGNRLPALRPYVR